MDYLFFGIQGSGKGTQTRLLEEKYGFAVFETGAELRAIAASETELGNKVKEIIESGNLVPVEIVMEIVENFLQNHHTETPILFDGIPRSLEQQKLLHGVLASHDRKYKAVHITLSDNVALERLLNRRILKDGQWVKRADDNPESIKKRIELFHEETKPLLANYGDQLITINGEPDVETVYAEIIDKLGLHHG